VFRQVPISGLHEDPANARKHPDRNRATVRASLQEFGQVEALVVEKGTGRVVGGNCRLRELRALGVEEVMVAEVDLHGIDATRLGLVLNRSAEIAEWDDEALTALLKSLDEEDALAGLGWDDGELAALLADVEPAIEPSDGDDDAPEPADGPPDSQPGEVYGLGPHRLVCGDCRDALVWEALLGKERLRMVWSDPPYGVAIVGGTKDPRSPRFADGKTIENDDLDAAGLRQLLTDALGMAAAHCEKGAAWYVAAPPGPLHNIFGDVLNKLGIWRRSIVWLKDSFVFGRGDYHYRHEPIFYGWVPGAAHYFIDDHTQDTVHECPRPKRSEEHPTMKPVALVTRHVENSSKPRWLVGDPFAGSGTTLIACALTGRVARCIELDPRYCDVIRRRWFRFAMEHKIDPGPGALE